MSNISFKMKGTELCLKQRGCAIVHSVKNLCNM